MRRRLTRLAAVAGLTMWLLAAVAGPATAEVIQEGCNGWAAFSNGTRVTESTPLSVVNLVPVEDTVEYYGTTNLAEPENEEPFSGHVSVRLPLGGNWVVVDWPDPPGSETKQVDAGGMYSYEVPSWVPKGTGGLQVTALHTQRGQTCEVAVVMAVEGDRGPGAFLGAAGTAMFAAGVIGAGFKRKVA